MLHCNKDFMSSHCDGQKSVLDMAEFFFMHQVFFCSVGHIINFSHSNFLKYCSTHDTALVLKYWQFLFKNFLSVVAMKCVLFT